MSALGARPMGRHSCRPTPSSIPTGPSPPPGGGGGSPPRRQHRNEAPTGLLRGYYKSYYEATTRLLRGYYVATTTLRGYYEATTRPLPGYYEATTRLLLGAARAPLGQQHSSSSTARLTAPLVLAARARRVGKNLGRGDINWANDNRPKMPK